MTLTMPKGQNPSLFGAAMRTLKDLKLTFDHSIALCQAINILTKNKLEKKKLLAVEKVCGSINGRGLVGN